MELLVSFDCHCRGVKFYDLRGAGGETHDPLCVAAWVPGIPGESVVETRPRMLGHVTKEAA